MAIEIIPDKICPHCGGNRWHLRMVKSRHIGYICTVIMGERVKKYREKDIVAARLRDVEYRKKNIEKVKLVQKKSREKHKQYYVDYMTIWRKENKEKVRLQRYNWGKNHPEAIKHYYNTIGKRFKAKIRRRTRNRRRFIENTRILSNSYIKHAIIMANRNDNFKIIRDQITQEDIDLYREGLEAKRIFRQKVNQLKSEKL